MFTSNLEIQMRIKCETGTGNHALPLQRSNLLTNMNRELGYLENFQIKKNSKCLCCLWQVENRTFFYPSQSPSLQFNLSPCFVQPMAVLQTAEFCESPKGALEGVPESQSSLFLYLCLNKEPLSTRRNLQANFQTLTVTFNMKKEGADRVCLWNENIKSGARGKRASDITRELQLKMEMKGNDLKKVWGVWREQSPI